MTDLEGDPTTRVVAFADHLRRAGLEVDTASTLTFLRSLAAFRPLSLTDVYWTGRACFTRSAADIAIYDRAFQRFEEPAGLEPTLESQGKMPVDIGAPSPDTDADRTVASSLEVLRSKGFDALTSDEARTVALLIESMALRLPSRLTRRTARGGKKGPLDARRTLRRALASGGEPFVLHRRVRRSRGRRVVFLVDVSGSMRNHSKVLLQLCYAVRKRHRSAEFFSFGTQLTRITRALDRPTPDLALEAVAELVPDRAGGTLIGTSIGAFVNGWGRKGMARGAVVVVYSDGLERGDPAELARQLQRLHRLAYRIVWVNPLKGTTDYEPLAQGMAAALPHIDSFMAGHDLSSLEELVHSISERVAH